jgi:hypothetical protein
MVGKSGIECRKLGVGARLALTPSARVCCVKSMAPHFSEGASLAHPPGRHVLVRHLCCYQGQYAFNRRPVSTVGRAL